jgi:hypothetical protein
MKNNNKNDSSYTDKICNLISAYVDNELPDEQRYFVMKNIENNEEYRNVYEDITKVKNILGSVRKDEASDSFEARLKARIQSDEQPKKIHDNIVSFRTISLRVASGLAAAAMFAFVLFFALSIGTNTKLDNVKLSESDGNASESSEVEASSISMSKESRGGIDYMSLDNGTSEREETGRAVILGPDEAEYINIIGSMADMKREKILLNAKAKEVGAAVMFNMLQIMDMEIDDISEVEKTQQKLIDDDDIQTGAVKPSNMIMEMSVDLQFKVDEQ